ncbi:MAG: DUF3870 domain-containing protein [Holosporaceae bacterium]|nr:DUF3870 domain-containing protein [Holosporaceae bacterium]
MDTDLYYPEKFAQRLFINREYYEFLEHNRYFGNELLQGLEELPESQKKVVIALKDMICDFIKGWDNFEEMLTIIGFAPVKLLDLFRN